MNRPIERILLAALVILLSGRASHGEATSDTSSAGAGLRVFVLTFGPGDDPWEKFGHNAVRLYDPTATGDLGDRTYNWGTFKFDNGFYWKFVQGRLLYEMSSDPSVPLLSYYADTLHRTIHQQELNLSPGQKIAIRNLLVANDTDENRYYLYDYYRNNCTTRIRDVLDDLIDHGLSKAAKGLPSGTTYRWHTNRLVGQTPWLYVAMQGILGHPVDRPIDRWQQMFLPQKLHDQLNDITIKVDGHDEPLVKNDVLVYDSARELEPSAPPRVCGWFIGVGVLLGGALAALGYLARRSLLARIGFVLLSVPWVMVMGVGGVIIAWAWLFTDHVVSRPNENILQVSLLALPLLVLLPMTAFGARRGARLTVILTFTIAGLACLGLLLKALPMFYQANWNIIALCLPPNVALAYAAWKMHTSLVSNRPLKAEKLKATASRSQF